MEFGLTIPHTGRYASPEWVREYCTVAEQVGFDSLWAVDHLVMPHHTDSEYTLGRKPAKIADDAVSGLLSPNYEMMTTLTWVAGFTERVKLGTAVAVLPIRNPEHHARALATLDVYSLRLFTSTPVKSDLSLAELLAEYRELGVEHVQVGLHRSSREETLDTMHDVAENVLPEVRA